MSNTKNHYDYAKVTTVELPPGRFLTPGDVIASTDLILTGKSEPVSVSDFEKKHPMCFIDGMTYSKFSFEYTYYRPDLPKLRPLPPGLPTGRYVQLGETLEATDLFVGWSISGYESPMTQAEKCNNVGLVATPGNEFHKAYWRPDKVVATKPLKGSPDPGDGYRLLENGEVLQSGDEYLSYDGEWTKTEDAGLSVDGQLLYRRKVESKPVVAPTSEPKAVRPSKKLDPGATYRLVKTGEVIRSTDEVYDPTTQTWRQVRGSAGSKRNKYSRPMRRLRVVAETKFDPGPGYKLLNLGDIRQEGDEYWTWGRWDTTVGAGMPIGNYFTYRRKVVPVAANNVKAEALKTKTGLLVGEGYRLLEEGEVIKDGDEYDYDGGGHWWEYSCGRVGEKWGKPLFAFRRKVT